MYAGLDARSARFLADLDRIQQRQARVQREVSSGLKVNRSSDAPERVIDILQLRSDVQRSTAIGMNLNRATAEVNTADAAITVAVQIVERARVLAAQTASSTAINRKQIAIEARQLHDQLVNLTFTVSEGRYIFSGDKDQTALYKADWTQAGGITRLTPEAANNTRVLEDANGSRFSISKSAHEIFDARNPDDSFAQENVFNAVYTLAKGLEMDDPDEIGNAATMLNASLEHLGRITTFYGQSQNRVRDAITLNSKALIARKEELGRAQDTDIAEALVELNLADVHHRAALGAQAQNRKTSLFDYLG